MKKIVMEPLKKGKLPNTKPPKYQTKTVIDTNSPKTNNRKVNCKAFASDLGKYVEPKGKIETKRVKF